MSKSQSEGKKECSRCKREFEWRDVGGSIKFESTDLCPNCENELMEAEAENEANAMASEAEAEARAQGEWEAQQQAEAQAQAEYEQGGQY